MPEVTKDMKERASLTFAEVVRATAEHFPEPRYRLKRLRAGALSERYVIRNLEDTAISGNSDGIGTKPEIIERSFATFHDDSVFESLAFDLAAMVSDDAARDGLFVLAIQNNLDVNSAEDPRFIAALARGLKRACDRGRFALLSGETAELGTRTPGYGPNHLNWNASAVVLVHEEKMFHPEKLSPGQPIVALRERSIRSNGLSRARAILENAYVQGVRGLRTREECIVRDTWERLHRLISEEDIRCVLNATYIGGEPAWDHFTVPWHLSPLMDLAEKLRTPSTIYTPLIYAAQGGVDGEVCVPIVAAAHISGGGVPLKAKRMAEAAGVGVHVEPVFPDPDGVPALIDLAQRYPDPKEGILVDDRTAYEQWNRGIGFLCVVEHQQRADELAALASSLGYEAKAAGEIIPERQIEWRGHTWRY